MNILLANPNTTASMTRRMEAAASAVVGPDTRITALTAAYGPPSVEGYYDEALCVPPLLEAVVPLARGADGVVVGCFDDTGVDALRCRLDVPVIGICQAAMQSAAVLSNTFSVITTLQRAVPALERLALHYGFERRCRRIRAAEVPVLDLEDPDSGALAVIEDEIERALEDDGAEAIVLGCAGMVEFSRILSAKFGVPVIEGVTAAVKTVEGLAALGLKTSSRGGYAPPRRKTYSGDFARFSPE